MVGVRCYCVFHESSRRRIELFANLPKQPGAGEGPDPLGSSDGDTELLGGFGLRQAGEETELDQLRRVRVD